MTDTLAAIASAQARLSEIAKSLEGAAPLPIAERLRALDEAQEALLEIGSRMLRAIAAELDGDSPKVIELAGRIRSVMEHRR